jgi:hypothetical protein
MDEHIPDVAEEYCRGTLDASRRAEVERHLARCEDCRNAYDDVRLAIDALGAWTTPAPVPRALESRIVGLVRRRAFSAWQTAAAAIVLALFAGGFGYTAGRQAGPSSGTTLVATADTSLRTFMLLLEESAWPPVEPLSLARDGYLDWMRDLQRLGRYIDAEKFTEEPGVRIAVNGGVASPAGVPLAQNLSGWYRLRARDYNEAVALARRGPHLRYGSILVRQIE